MTDDEKAKACADAFKPLADAALKLRAQAPLCQSCGEKLVRIPSRDHEYGSDPNTGGWECRNECPVEA